MVKSFGRLIDMKIEENGKNVFYYDLYIVVNKYELKIRVRVRLVK